MELVGNGPWEDWPAEKLPHSRGILERDCTHCEGKTVTVMDPTGRRGPGCWKHGHHTGTSHFRQTWRRKHVFGREEIPGCVVGVCDKRALGSAK